MFMKKVLIIGLGIGELYKKVLLESRNGHKYDVITIDPDPNKNADFVSLEACYKLHPYFDLAVICCPNQFHESYVLGLNQNKMAGMILVEKPGLKNFATWALYTNAVSPNKLIMVKNNLYREDLLNQIKKTIKDNITDISEIRIDWLNHNRVPSPGSWFTNKDLAWGGVSRDLMPHLLSIYYGIFNELDIPFDQVAVSMYTLDQIKDTEYGAVLNGGVYNVDDTAAIFFKRKVKRKNIPISLNACWKNETETKIGVTIVINNHPVFYDFGLCPESAYLKMIEQTLKMDEKECEKHKNIDCWIHQILDNYGN